MRKYILLVVSCLFLFNRAESAPPDTTISYFKNYYGRLYKVSTLDSADFFRITFPPDESQQLYNIKEYYKSGAIKFIGQFDPMANGMFDPGTILLEGDGLSYFPTGKRQSIAHYTHGERDGNEYEYYPNGLIYCYRKYSIPVNKYSIRSKIWECYDTAGKMICSEGNGEWIEYSPDFKKIIVRGTIKNGYLEGEWHGRSPDFDSIKFTYVFKKGVVLSAVGFDKAGVAHPFVKEAEFANYKGGAVTFVDVFTSHLNLPKDSNGKKISVDTVHISFTIEKDGRISGFKTLGVASPELNKALFEALAKCRDWTPTRLYGVPLRTQMILPLNLAHGYNGNRYEKEVFVESRILGF